MLCLQNTSSFGGNVVMVAVVVMSLLVGSFVCLALLGAVLLDLLEIGLELLLIDATVVVRVDILKDLLDLLIQIRIGVAAILVAVLMEGLDDFSDLLTGKDTIVVGVERGETGVEALVLVEELGGINSCGQEFGVLNLLAAIVIETRQEIIAHVRRAKGLLQLIVGQSSVAIVIVLSEHLSQFLDFKVSVRVAELVRHGDKHGLLELSGADEISHVVDDLGIEVHIAATGGLLTGNPIDRKDLLGRGTGLLILGQHLGDGELGLSGDTTPLGGVELVGTLADLLQDFSIGVAVEGRIAAKHDVCDDTQRPDIALLSVLALKNLGGDVVGGTGLGAVQLSFLERFGETEINELDLVEHGVGFLGGQKEILRLQITMDNLILMAVEDGGDHLTHEMLGLHLREGLVLDDGIEQLATRAQLHNELEGLGILEDLVQMDHVGVIHLAHGVKLGTEFVGIAHLLALDGLHGNETAVGTLADVSVHGTVCALAQTGLVGRDLGVALREGRAAGSLIEQIGEVLLHSACVS